MYDVVIVGMGIGGVTSGIYARQANLKVLMLESKIPGGILNNINKVENYTGLPSILGYEFADNLTKQVEHLKIPYKIETVEKIEVLNDKKLIHTNKEVYETKNIIFATGRKPKFLGVDKEKDLLGKGLCTCATCDGMFYKDKDVAVVGGGNSALQEALYLANIVNKIYLLVRKDHFRGSELLVEAVKNNEKIEIMFESQIEKINETDGKIESILLNTGKTINVSGVFIYVGYAPDTSLIKHLDIVCENGYVLVDENYETKVKGLYAVGDVIKKELYQLITAAAEGALAATHIANKK